MLKRGCKGMREEAQARLAALEHPRDLAFKGPFYEAAIITCDALSLFARRYSELAAEMAAKTKDAQRKKELEEIAAICAWVPENPARTFREAVQSQWFTQLFARFEEMVGGQINSAGWTSISIRRTSRTSKKAGSRRKRRRSCSSASG